jgi:hypothetical protein
LWAEMEWKAMVFCEAVYCDVEETRPGAWRAGGWESREGCVGAAAIADAALVYARFFACDGTRVEDKL